MPTTTITTTTDEKAVSSLASRLDTLALVITQAAAAVEATEQAKAAEKLAVASVLPAVKAAWTASISAISAVDQEGKAITPDPTTVALPIVQCLSSLWIERLSAVRTIEDSGDQERAAKRLYAAFEPARKFLAGKIPGKRLTGHKSREGLALLDHKPASKARAPEPTADDAVDATNTAKGQGKPPSKPESVESGGDAIRHAAEQIRALLRGHPGVVFGILSDGSAVRAAREAIQTVDSAPVSMRETLAVLEWLAECLSTGKAPALATAEQVRSAVAERDAARADRDEARDQLRRERAASNAAKDASDINRKRARAS